MDKSDTNSAIELYKQFKFAEAEKKFLQILKTNPEEVDAWRYMGLISYRFKKYDVALKFFDFAIKIDGTSRVYLDKANVYAAMNNYEEAIVLYKKLIADQIFLKDVYNNLGVVYEKMEKYDEAVKYYAQALEYNPLSPYVYTNLGVAYSKAGNLKKALECYYKALELKPDFAMAHYNIAVACKDDLDEAISRYLTVLKLDKDYGKAYLNLAICYLLKKDFCNGWKAYEDRFKVLHEFKPLVKRPIEKWNGQNLDNKVIYVYYEQGYGDTIQFCRYLSLLRKLNPKKIFFKPQKGLETLLKRSNFGVEIVDADVDDETVQFDYYLPLLSLLYHFNIGIERKLQKQTYLFADEAKIIDYQNRYFKTDKLKVGIFWQGSPEHHRDKERSLPLETFSSLFENENIQFYSLQKGYGIEQLKNIDKTFNIVDLGSGFNDFDDSAAAIKNLDVVITVDSAIAHLSAALGVETWIILPLTSEWRWFLEEETSFWYENTRLFRRNNNDDTFVVMQKMKKLLEKLCN